MSLESVESEVGQSVSSDSSKNGANKPSPQHTVAEKTVRDLDEKAQSVVQNHVYTALGAGLIPIPLVDLVALAGIQLNMVHRIAAIYDVPFKKDVGKSAIAALVGSLTPVSVAGPSASLMKVIPLVGSVAGFLTMSVFGGAATYAVGKVFTQHFAAGGTFLDFDPESVKEHFAEKFKEGEHVARKVKGSSKE